MDRIGLATVETQGWCLESGEERQAANPDTFEIPPIEIRCALRVGDFAQLIFKIAFPEDEDPFEYERMWVIVTEVLIGSYVGKLDNQPASLGQNDLLWLGTEVAFEPRHIISALAGDR